MHFLQRLLLTRLGETRVQSGIDRQGDDLKTRLTSQTLVIAGLRKDGVHLKTWILQQNPELQNHSSKEMSVITHVWSPDPRALERH